MKIVYTYRGLQNIGGVLKYFYEIIKRVQKEHDAMVISKYSSTRYLSELVPQAGTFLFGLPMKGKQRLENYFQDRYLNKKLQQTDFDVIHDTEYNPSFFEYSRNKPIVMTVHDMIPEIFQTCQERIIDRKICFAKVQHIICVSHNTKKDLLNIYPELDDRKISVIHHGVTVQTDTDLPNRWGNYVLYVGDRKSAYKNFLPFVQAMQKIVQNSDVRIICTGCSFTKEEMQYFNSLNLQDRILCVGFVDEQTLHSLYRHALCFVYPSKYEGFGIPILEAFQNGCPVCLSDASCFPEVAGNAAAYFNPGDITSMTTTIESVINDHSLRNGLVEKGTDRLSLYSWDRAAKQTVEVYQNCIQ